MYKLFDWVYNRRLNLIGIICEERSGQYKSEYAIFYPGYKEAHTGRGFSQHGYSSEGLFFYTEGLMQDRIVPLNPDDEIMMSARNVSGAMGNRASKNRRMKEIYSSFFEMPTYANDYRRDPAYLDPIFILRDLDDM